MIGVKHIEACETGNDKKIRNLIFFFFYSNAAYSSDISPTTISL